MTKFRNYLFGAVGLVILVGALVLSSPSTTTDNPVPTLAQGTTTIAGNVSVTNTPTVNLASGATVGINNMPTVDLASGASVGVNNTKDNPLFVRSVDDAVRQVFQKQFNFIVADGSFGQNAVMPVPVGKRVVIEHVSAAGIDHGNHRLRYEVLTTQRVGAVQVQSQHFLVAESQGDGLAIWMASQPIHVYGDGGTTIVVDATRELSTGTADVSMTVSGYFVDVP
jgi:hypothetical protein